MKLLNLITICVYVKETVSRDFSPSVFFIKQLFLVPMGMPRNDFEFFRIFVELFVFVIDSPVVNTPRSHDSTVMNTPRSRLLGVFGTIIRTGLYKSTLW